MGIGHCSHQATKKRERETWTLHHWTTTLDITTAVDIATLDNIGQQPLTLQPLATKMLWTLHQWTTALDIAAIDNKNKRERDLDIASLDNNIGHYNCCGHCINGQQHWTTTLDIAAINNNKEKSCGRCINVQQHWTLQPSGKQKK